ncbi:MAG: hypothetical protein Fur0022_32150 [Anaerolineales bacterium]
MPSIQTRLTRTSIGLALVPLIILGLLVTWQGLIFQQEALARQQQIAKQVALEVEGYFASLEEELELVIQLEGGEGLRRQEPFGPLFRVLTYGAVFEELTYINEAGNELVRETRLGVVSEEELRNRRGEIIFEIPFTQAANFFSPIQINPATGEPVIDISLPVKNELENRIEGVLVAKARLLEIWAIIEAIPLSNGQTIYIITEQGQIIAHPNPSIVIGREVFIPPRASGITNGFEGGWVLLATEPIVVGQQTLTAVVEQTVLTAFALPLNMIGTTALVSFIALGVAIRASLRSVRQIVHPIQTLAETARTIQAGNWPQNVAIESQDEVGELAQAFDLMVKRLRTSLASLEAEVVERTQAEEALRQAETRFRTLVEQLPAITYIDDLRHNFGKTLYISPQVTTLLGYSQEEWLSLTLEDWLNMLPAEDRPGFLEAYQNCAQAGQALECEYRLRAKNGQIIWFHDRAIRLNDQKGPCLLQGVMIDITERKKAEEEIHRLNAELEARVYERTSQLETANQELESFTYSISHDLRTPLRGIIGFSSLLLNNPDNQLSPEGQHHLKRVLENAQRMGQLVDDLLKFARLSRQPISKHIILPARLVHEVLNDLTLEINNRHIELTVQDLPPCQADPSLLRQVFTNLISNAIKYTRHTPQAQIEIGWKSMEHQTVYFVRDNGIGFDMQYVHKLFGVFQRLHNLEDFEGTGVGLAITQRIIQRHGGDIWAEAKVGEGATFFFTLEAR